MLNVFYELFAARILVIWNVLNNSFTYKHFNLSPVFLLYVQFILTFKV